MTTFVEKKLKNLSESDIQKRIRNQYKHINLHKLKKCIIYGASKEAEIFIRKCHKYNILIDNVIDDKKRGYLAGYKIYKSLNKKEKKYIPIIICTHRFGMVWKKLKNSGYNNIIPLWTLQILEPKKFGCHKYYKNWAREFKQNIRKYSIVEKIFEENKSKKIWKNFIMFKLTFNPNYLNSIVSYGDDYFPRDLNLHISKQEIFFDGGGWIGDSVKFFIKKFSKFKKIYTYEPSNKLSEQLKRKFPNSKIIIKNCGMSNNNQLDHFCDIKDSSSFFTNTKSSETTKVKTEAIDEMNVKDENVTIKMNIEGYEKKALLGARKTIKKNNTNLILALNDRPQDLTELPLFILTLGIKYDYYLRLHDYGVIQLVLYAISKKRKK